MNALTQMEPLISSTTVGPLGIMHLPRLWLKLLLDARGMLPEGYRAGDGGFDGGVCSVLGIEPADVVAYVRSESPDYLTFERWVQAHATSLTPQTVARWNLHAAGGKMTNVERLEEWSKRFDTDVDNAAALNQLDDWAGIHARLTAKT